MTEIAVYSQAPYCPDTNTGRVQGAQREHVAACHSIDITNRAQSNRLRKDVLMLAVVDRRPCSACRQPYQRTRVVNKP